LNSRAEILRFFDFLDFLVKQTSRANILTKTMVLHAGYEDNPQDLEVSWIRLSSHCDPVEVLATIATRHLLEQGDFLNRDLSTAAAME